MSTHDTGSLPSRRDVCAGALVGLAAAAVPRFVTATPVSAPRRSLRIAHLTDIHLQPEREAARGLAACLEHVQSPPVTDGTDAPDLIITGGDTIMDGFEKSRDRTKVQWDLWRKVKADHCGVDVKSVIGNHDVWGWMQAKAGTTGSEPLYGKAWACEEFGRATPWESFDRGGWHIVLLDSTYPHKESYIGRIDDAQWDWLERDLAAVPASTPVLLVSHIPILSIYPLAAARAATSADGLPTFSVNGNLVHVDHQRFRGLFAKHPNVKACLSGHLHIVEAISYGGVSYLCNGAVSAGWWRGLHQGTDYGYAMVDLFDDGAVTCRYVPYGWTTQA